MKRHPRREAVDWAMSRCHMQKNKTKKGRGKERWLEEREGEGGREDGGEGEDEKDMCDR